jgi:hypothetical protein
MHDAVYSTTSWIMLIQHTLVLSVLAVEIHAVVYMYSMFATVPVGVVQQRGVTVVPAASTSPLHVPACVLRLESVDDERVAGAAH